MREKIIALSLNFIIIVCETIALTSSIINEGIGLFRFYTKDSNILLFIASIITFIYLLLEVVYKKKIMPKWTKVLKYVSVCTVTLTFVTVVLVLSPMYDDGNALWMMLFDGTMLYYHTICPMLAIVSFLFFEENYCMNIKSTLYGVIPTFAYAAVVFPLNILKIMVGPYPFLFVYEQPWYMSIIWSIVMLGGSYLLAYLLYFFKKTLNKKEKVEAINGNN